MSRISRDVLIEKRNGTRCQIQGCYSRSAAKCTHLFTWHVCELHAAICAANGLYPYYLNAPGELMTPEEGVWATKAIRGGH